MTGVRLRPEGYEGKCNACAEWWPLTEEFWYARQGMARCRACINEAQTRGARRERASVIELQAIRRAERLRYRREWMRAYRARERAA